MKFPMKPYLKRLVLRKKKVALTIDNDLYEDAVKFKINLSKACEVGIKKLIDELRTERRTW